MTLKLPEGIRRSWRWYSEYKREIPYQGETVFHSKQSPHPKLAVRWLHKIAAVSKIRSSRLRLPGFPKINSVRQFLETTPIEKLRQSPWSGHASIVPSVVVEKVDISKVIDKDRPGWSKDGWTRLHDLELKDKPVRLHQRPLAIQDHWKTVRGFHDKGFGYLLGVVPRDSSILLFQCSESQVYTSPGIFKLVIEGLNGLLQGRMRDGTNFRSFLDQQLTNAKPHSWLAPVNLERSDHFALAAEDCHSGPMTGDRISAFADGVCTVRVAHGAANDPRHLFNRASAGRRRESDA
ncbi:hypothetical protein OUZ56_033113 [Daphnia magna]|uniref:Uncharacterized protein n=1 Tax=Daphnia magna TaxID=35525 RepID=A0ABR0BA77_9CRUS|nr:hypothetical protein OUZ56_033113 [Daphnia magna]